MGLVQEKKSDKRTGGGLIQRRTYILLKESTAWGASGKLGKEKTAVEFRALSNRRTLAGTQSRDAFLPPTHSRPLISSLTLTVQRDKVHLVII